MKIALIGDPHFANHRMFGKPTAEPGVNSRLAAVTTTLQWIAQDIADHERNVNSIVILGDITHHHGVLTPAVADQIEVALLDLGNVTDELVVISGNHDMDVNGRSIVPFVGGEAASRIGAGKLRLIEGMFARKYGPKHAVWFASYGVEAEDLNVDMAERFGDPELTRIALMHHSFEGAVHGAHEFEPPGGLHASDLVGDVRVWSGHYHKEQRLFGGRIRYTGSPLQHDFGESTYTPGYLILDLREDGSVVEEFIETPTEVTPRFHILPYDLDVKKIPGYPGKDYYRIDLPSDVDPKEAEKLRKKLHNVIFKNVSVSSKRRSRVEEYLSDMKDESGEERLVEIDDTIDAYTAMNVDNTERAEELARMGKDIIGKMGGSQ